MLRGNSYNVTCIEDAERFEKEILNKYNFALERVLTNTEKAVLSILIDTPSTPTNEIAKAMEISIEETNEIIQELQNIGALDVNFNPMAVSSKGAKGLMLLYGHGKTKLKKQILLIN